MDAIVEMFSSLLGDADLSSLLGDVDLSSLLGDVDFSQYIEIFKTAIEYIVNLFSSLM